MLYAPDKEDDDYDTPDFVCFRCMREYSTYKCQLVSATWPKDPERRALYEAEAAMEWVYKQVGRDATLKVLNKLAIEYGDKN